jgi:enoyl-CoA hydratase/3-hydroxyacyl-CoA dehydrogenase
VYDPRTIAIVGAGNMGAGIAQKIAQEGYQCLLADMSLERAQAGLERIGASLQQAVERRILSEEQRAATLSRITAVGELGALGEADLVIEAIFEDLDIKKQLLRDLDRCCKPGCVLATNTSSFYVQQLADATQRPELVVGLHYFYHPAKNRLLEVIPARETPPELTAAMVRFAEGHGKTALVVADRPGFAVNRFFVPWLNEAVRLVEEGVADIPTVEQVARQTFAIGMGPFELMNVTGIVVGLHAASTLGRELGPFYEPSPLLAAQVEKGEQWNFAGECAAQPPPAIAERLMATVFTVAGQLLDEQVCSIEDVDRGARIGLRWARGPFQLLNERGLSAAAAMVSALCDRHDDLQMPRSIATQLGSGLPFEFRRVDLDIVDKIARITINRPEVLNALDEEVVAQLRECLEQALATPGLRAVVLAGAGKAFVAGADISFFVRNIEAQDIERIVKFTRAGQELLRRIETAPVPVIARVHGMALGGGTELALACHGIVCSDKATFALPETGIGIYPGLGGTQRLPRIVGQPLARRLIFTGKPLSARDAVTAGLALESVPIQELDECISRWIERGIPDHYNNSPSGDSAVLEAYADKAIAPLLSGQLPEGLSGEAHELLQRDLRAIGRKAPLALAAAARLISDGGALDLPAGLDLELAGLAEIFTTQDALTGLKSVASRERPSWQGA